MGKEHECGWKSCFCWTCPPSLPPYADTAIPSSWIHTHTRLSTHYQIPSAGMIVCNLCIMRLLWDASLPWCLSCFVWIYFILFPLHFHVCSPERLIKVWAVLLSSDSSDFAALFIHLLVGLTYICICWGGILISCNFPVWEWQCGKQKGGTQMWIWWSDRWRIGVKLTLEFTPIKCQVPYVSGGHIVPAEESECKSIICFSFCGWNWSPSQWYELLLSRAMIVGRWKVGRPTWDLKWALI